MICDYDKHGGSTATSKAFLKFFQNSLIIITANEVCHAKKLPSSAVLQQNYETAKLLSVVADVYYVDGLRSHVA